MEFSAPEIGALISRWVHILFAVIVVGGVFFMRFVVHGATAEALDEAGRKALRDAVVKRWKRWVMISITLLLASGLYNYLVVTRQHHSGQGLYHALFGVKFLLALAFFMLGSVLTGRAKAFDRLRERAPLWQGVLFALAVLIILIAGVMKLIPPALAT